MARTSADARTTSFRRLGNLTQRERWTRRAADAYSRRAAPPRRLNAQVAQLVEHVTENHGVGGSIPPLGTINIKDLGFDGKKPASGGLTWG